MTLVFADAYAAGTSTEDKVKAGLIFNFINFTRWPEHAFPLENERYILCVAGEDHYSEIFDAIPDLSVRGRKLQLKHLEKLQDKSTIQSCHILIVGLKNRTQVSQLLGQIKDSPVLTIGESVPLDTMITFVNKGNKVGFAINRTRAAHSGIKFSSKMLRLAIEVTGRGPDA